MILPLLIGLMIQFNDRPHPTGKTFCERHLIDWDPDDEQTKEYLEKNKDE
jgi:hypothetical protein